MLYLVAVVSILACCRGKQENDQAVSKESQQMWPIFRGNPELTGNASGQLPETLQLAWTFKAEDEIKSSPVVGLDRVFIGASNGKIYALDINTGRLTWDFATESVVEAPPLLVETTVIVGTLDGALVALDASSGQLRWQYKTGSKIVGSANWVSLDSDSSHLILVGSYDHNMHCIDLETGKPVWIYDTQNFINGAPARYEKNVVFGGCDALLHVVSAADGSNQAKIDVISYAAASPAIKDHYAYLGNYDGQLHCIDLVHHKITWTYEDSAEAEPYLSSPAVTDDRVVIGSQDGRLHCVARASGERLWTFRTRGDVDCSPVICGDKVIFGSVDGRLYLVQLANGEELWSYDVGAAISSSPAVVDGRVIIGAEDGNVYAFRTGN